MKQEHFKVVEEGYCFIRDRRSGLLSLADYQIGEAWTESPAALTARVIHISVGAGEVVSGRSSATHDSYRPALHACQSALDQSGQVLCVAGAAPDYVESASSAQIGQGYLPALSKPLSIMRAHDPYRNNPQPEGPHGHPQSVTSGEKRSHSISLLRPIGARHESSEASTWQI